MRAVSRSLFLFLVISACVGCDQATKSLAQTTLGSRDALALMNGTLRLLYVENPGAFLSLGSGLSAEWRFWLFVVLSSLMLAAFAWLTLSAEGARLLIFAFALLIGGGCGNLIDRATFGFVRDFAQLQVGYWRTGVFNLADAAITIGCLMLLVRPQSFSLVFRLFLWKRGVE
jgi:signal peptidase II